MGGWGERDGDLVADSNREGHTCTMATVMNQFFSSQDVTATLWAFAVLKELPGMKLIYGRPKAARSDRNAAGTHFT